MNYNMMSLTGVLAALLVSATGGAAQQKPVSPRPTFISSVVALHGSDGKIEIVGLKRWSVQMLEDSLKKYFPGQPLEAGACMVLLGKLGFASTSVLGVEHADTAKASTIIGVIEPQDSSLVQWRKMTTRKSPIQSRYMRVVKPLIVDTVYLNLRLFMPTLQAYAGSHHLGMDSVVARAATYGRLKKPEEQAAVDGLLAFLFKQTGASTYDNARRTLAADGNAINRVFAAATLVNFADRDETYLELARALRDPDEQVRNVAMLDLEMMAQRSPRTIDWTPVAADLNAVMRGASVGSVIPLASVLLATHVSPLLARDILAGSSQLIVGYAQTTADYTGRTAKAFLKRMSGIDYSEHPERWAEWAERLKSSGPGA